MPRFYFHLHNQVSARDKEGRELADLGEAMMAATRDIRSMLSDDASHGRLDLRGRIDIADSDNTTLCSVSFFDAVEVYLPGDAQ